MSVLPAIIREPEERHDDDAVLQQKGGARSRRATDTRPTVSEKKEPSFAAWIGQFHRNCQASTIWPSVLSTASHCESVRG